MCRVSIKLSLNSVRPSESGCGLPWPSIIESHVMVNMHANVCPNIGTHTPNGVHND